MSEHDLSMRREVDLKALAEKVDRIEADLDDRWAKALALAVAVTQAAQDLVRFLQESSPPPPA
jgi:hypothetical protein